MTTNVFDGDAWELASDSRWSIVLPQHAVIYVDDTRFDKIIVHGTAGSLFAGDSERIAEWKQWIRNPLRGPKPPEANGIAVCLVNLGTGVIAHELGQAHTIRNSRFAGSGGKLAAACWDKNACAKKAVETAKLDDVCSGGAVKFVEAKTGNSNVFDVDDIQHIRKELQQRGMVMYLTSAGRVSVPLDVAVANDPMVKEIAEKVAKGEASLTAPCPSVSEVWTEEEKGGLYKAMLDFYPPA